MEAEPARVKRVRERRCVSGKERMRSDCDACACRKSNPDILVVQPAENWAAKNLPGPFDGARERRILLQGEMRAGAIVQHDDGTPTGSRSTSFFIRGILGPDAWSIFMRWLRRLAERFSVAASLVGHPCDGWRFLPGCSSWL